jgi:hypothetical protein
MFAPITQEPKSGRSNNAEQFKLPYVPARGSIMCAVHRDHTDCARSTRYVKQDWEKFYRAAVLEPDRSKLLQRIKDAEAAILERSRGLSTPPGNNGEEQDAITRALHILSLLREAGQEA